MPFTSSQLLELFVVFCTVDHFRYDLFKFGSASAHAELKGGAVRPDSMPTRFYRFIVPLQLFTYLFVPSIYLFSVARNRFQQPSWMDVLALPEAVDDVEMEPLWKNSLRVLACVASVALQRLSDDVLEHLGDQFHPIGRREKPRVVQTGPYAWVRHPLYTWMILQQLLWILMFWSYAPLFELFINATILAIKIDIEEEAIQRDDAIKEEYRAYMQRVPAKLVPSVF